MVFDRLCQSMGTPRRPRTRSAKDFRRVYQKSARKQSDVLSKLQVHTERRNAVYSVAHSQRRQPRARVADSHGLSQRGRRSFTANEAETTSRSRAQQRKDCRGRKKYFSVQHVARHAHPAQRDFRLRRARQKERG